ncbi:SIMPL domain-containing protein [Paenibacillus sp. CC-CFT747]|nr:SIMPL domain-containing protein [Paenibacillus sp. CC-CFT747]
MKEHCPNVIEVIGEGKANAVPDEAVIVLGVDSQGLELQKVQAENAAAVSAIIRSLLALSVPRENIQTTDYRIEPQYDYPDGKAVFRGYKVTHLLRIENGEIGLTGQIVDTAVSQGANNVSSISFDVKHREAYVQEALSLAIRNARQKAEAIAVTLRIPLPALPCEVQELPPASGPVPYSAALYAKSEAATPIQPGQISITASVRVTYPIS